MPFSKQNRMATILVIAILIVLSIGVSGIVSIANHGNSSATPIITSIIGFVGIAINQLLGMLRSEIAKRDQDNQIAQTNNLIVDQSAEIKNHAEAAKSAAESAQQAVQETSQKLEEIREKVNGNLETAVEKAVLSERHQVLSQLPLPKTNEELEAMIKKIVIQTSQQLKKQ
jgi:hypothetical protein